MLRRMGDSSPDIRSLATLTFAQLVKLMPLDGAKGAVPGLLEELAQEKVKQKVRQCRNIKSTFSDVF